VTVRAVPVRLILEVAAGSRLEARLREQPPMAVHNGDVAVVPLPSDPDGNLEASRAGQVVLSVPAPETLTREPEKVHHVIDHAGSGVEPLVVVVEAAEQLLDEELAVVLDAAKHARRDVILRVVEPVSE
jgi:hypothetical protein